MKRLIHLLLLVPALVIAQGLPSPSFNNVTANSVITSALTLSGTGGPKQVLRQSTLGGVVTVGQMDCSDLADAGPLCSASGFTGARRTIIAGTADTATKADYLILWSSSVAAIKAQTIPDCDADTDKVQLVIGDEIQTAGAFPITIAPLASGTINNLASIPIASNGGFAAMVCDGSQTNWVVTYLSTSANIPSPGGRITLASATPVMYSTQASKTTLYYTVFNAAPKVPYFNGFFDLVDAIPNNEVSSALASSGPGVLNAGNLFDVWWSAANHNICIATNGTGGGWASDTGGSNQARGTGFTALDKFSRGYPTNKNVISDCNNGATNYGPFAANRLTYLGTIETSANGTVSWVYGTKADGGGAASFGICNYYNNVPISTLVQDGRTSSWTDPDSNWKAFNAPGTQGGLGNRVTWVSCDGEKTVAAELSAGFNAGANNSYAFIGISPDTATPSAAAPGSMPVGNGLGQRNSFVATYRGNAGAGLRFVQAVQKGNTTAAGVFFADQGATGIPIVEGLFFMMLN